MIFSEKLLPTYSLYQYLNGEGENLDTHPSNVRCRHLSHQRGELVPVLVHLLHGQGPEDGPEVTLECLEDGALDLVLLLAKELLGGCVQQLGVLHDFHLNHKQDLLIWKYFGNTILT